MKRSGFSPASMSFTFRDHFSSTAPDYARFRPGYPRELFEWVAAESASRALVWDAATGSGQAALGLASHFDRVVATDASASQLASAAAHPRVRYVRSRAEASGLATSCAGAVVAAQAVHWFDMAAFFAEAGRVAMPGGLIAVWTYGNPSVTPEIDEKLEPFYRDVIGPYWPPERAIVERMYRDIDLPFEPVAVPSLSLELPMTLDAFGGYMGTWSGVQRYRAARGSDPVPGFIASIASLWGGGERMTTWPLAIRAGRAV